MYQRDIALSYLFDIALISLKCDIYIIVIFMKCTTYLLLQKGMTFFLNVEGMSLKCHFYEIIFESNGITTKMISFSQQLKL